MKKNQFLIDGIDRLGKSTLVNSLLQELGYHLVIHYDKPKLLNYYVHEDKSYNLKQYQVDCNRQMFELLNNPLNKLIIDRTHLGELVYAPLYRDYSGDYVYQFEKDYNTENARLILLTTSNFELCVDDGESFNFDNKEREQQLFVDAFNKSNIEDKIIIDVHGGGGKFKDPKDILLEALRDSK